MNPNTFKSKMFWSGVLQVAAGGALIYSGSVDTGILLCGTGLTSITGSDRLTKVLESHKDLVAKLLPKE